MLLPLLALLPLLSAGYAQDLEPRRWTHLPVGLNVASLKYGYTGGDILLDPVLEIENATTRAQTVVTSYSRSLDVLGATGRLDAILPFQHASWKGDLSGEQASTTRDGMSDPWLRMSVNLLGAPALEGQAFRDYRRSHRTNTIVGAAVAVMLPLGQYDSSKLINLGQNRFIVRPQFGVVHSRGPWSYELTGSAFLFTTNDEFRGDNELAQDPLYMLQGHVIHTLPSKVWFSASAGYSWGGQTRQNGIESDNETSQLLAALSVGLPLNKSQALKFGYIHGDTQRRIGADTQSLFVAWSFRF